MDVVILYKRKIGMFVNYKKALYDVLVEFCRGKYEGLSLDPYLADQIYENFVVELGDIPLMGKIQRNLKTDGLYQCKLITDQIREMSYVVNDYIKKQNDENAKINGLINQLFDLTKKVE